MDNSDLLKRIEIERERRDRIKREAKENETAEAEPNPESPKWPTLYISPDGVDDAIDYAENVSGAVVGGALSMVPGADRLKQYGIGDTTLKGPVAKGAEYVGMAAPLVLGAPAAASVGARKIGSGVMKTMIDDIGRFAINNPGMYFGGEAGAAFTAGALGEKARLSGASQGDQLAAEVVGGVIGGVPAAGARSVRALTESLTANLAPFTDDGGMIRAARDLQGKAGGSERARKFAGRLEDIPEGVTPSRWIGDERLMAQETRVMSDNPDLDNRVQDILEEARILAQKELQDAAGKPRTRQEWERTLIEKAAAPGAVIDAGFTDEMLDQAYRSFKPLYDKARGHPITSETAQKDILGAVDSRSVISGPKVRKYTKEWLDDKVKAYGDYLTSDDLIDLRSKVRKERFRQLKAQKLERSDLLDSVEMSITEILEEQLPEEAARVLRSADDQYWKYKGVEDAIYRSGDNPFTPEIYSESLRKSGATTPSQYARGVDPEVQALRRVALGGRPADELLGDPRRAALVVRDLSPSDRKSVQADFVRAIFDRSKSEATTEAGTVYLSGKDLMKNIEAQTRTMRSLGMGDGEIKRMREIATKIKRMEKRPPAAVASMFDDGVSSFIDLGAAVLGARSGQHVSGGGIGAGLVLAQFFSNRARKMIAGMTSDRAAQLLMDAMTDPKLYKALLVKNVTEKDIKQKAKYVEGWLMASGADKLQEEENGE